MNISLEKLYEGLFEEHLEEASFLYEQRLMYLEDLELSWRDIGDWEERFEKHIDALMIGQALALEVCIERCNDGDAGEMHAALRVLCRQGRKEQVFRVLSELDREDEPKVTAAALALRVEAPPSWQQDLVRVCQGAQKHLIGVLASVFGFRRFPYESALIGKLEVANDREMALIAWALGRIGSESSLSTLHDLINNSDNEVRKAASLAVMRLGDAHPVQHALLAAQAHRWPRYILAIGGDGRAVNVLLDVLRGRQPDKATVIGLGLLGDLRAVAPLIEKLDDDDLGDAAAIALNTLTGAELMSEVFVAEEFNLDELFEAERKKYDETGELPRRHNGEPYGAWERKPLRDAAQWRAWLSANQQRFSREHRWRMGRPYGPVALLECLRSATSPYVVRSACYEELVVRYGLDVPFEVDLPVTQQDRFIKSIETWANMAKDKFVNGSWYFAGQRQR